MHLGAIAQHPTCEEGVVGIRFEGENAIGDVGEGVGEEPNVCTDVDGNTAARYQFGKDRELRLTRACLYAASSSPCSAAWPLAARAQRAGKLRTIGFLGPNAHSAANEWVAALAQRLCDVET